MTSEPARCLPLSRSDGTLVRSSCPHRNTGSSRRVWMGGGERERAMGPVDPTAETHRVDGTLDSHTWI